MADAKDDIIKQLQINQLALQDMFVDLLSTVEAMRRLLYRKGVLSHVAFLAMKGDVLQQLKAVYEQNADKVLDAHQKARLHKLLEDFEGEPQ